MAEDTEEKAVWEDNPQTVYEKYSAGEASIEDYIKSLSICDVTEFAKQSHNFVKVYGDMKNQYESASSTAGEKKAAQHYMLVLESIHNDQSEKFENLQQPAATQTGETRTSSLAERTRQGHDRLHGNAGNSAEFADDFAAFGASVSADFDSFGHEADDGVVILNNEVKREYEDNTRQVEKEYEENKQQVEEEYEENKQQVEEEYEENKQQVEEEYEDNKQQVEEEHEAYNQQAAEKMTEFNRQKAEEELKFREEMQQYQQNPYTIQDYSAKVTDLGLTNSTVLNSSRGTRTRSMNGLTYTRNSQTEFRQADNGFALMQDNQIRAVTIDENNNPHFKINENGQTSDMTKEEADAFLHDLNENKNGKLLEQFNDGLLSTIEATGTANITPEKTRDEINEDFAQAMEQPWESQEIHEAEHEQFEEMDMSPENVAATETQTFSGLQKAADKIKENLQSEGVTVDLNGDTKTPNSDTFSELQKAADKIKENLQSGGATVDLAPSEELQADSNTFSALQQAGQRVMDNIDLNAGETVDLAPSEELQADPNTFSALQQSGQRVMDNIDLNAGETITLNPPANAAVARAKMDKVMDDAAEAFAGIKGVKIERGTVDISNGEFKFTPREAPAAEQPTPTDNKTAEVKAAPTTEKAAPTEEKAAPAPQSHEAEAVSPDIADMAKKIRYMNTVNNAEEGSAKYVDPQETAQKMYALYGENASTLLNEAIMAPNDVNNHANGAITSRTQTYSREAVDYLANLSPEQAKEYANRVLSPAELGPEKSPQEKLQDGLADMKTNNPEQYGDFTSAISQLVNGGNLEDALMQLALQMMKQAGYADSPEGMQAFTQDAQTAIRQIEHSERLEKAKTGIEMPTAVNVAQTQIKPIDMEKIKGIKLDSYGLVEGSEQAQKHNEDLEQYRELYKTDPKKFEKAKEGYEKAVKSGETTGQAKYNLDVINTVEKEEKLKEQMLKDQEKAAKQIKKLEKKIEKAKSKGNDEKAKSLQEELDKLMKEQGLKKEDEGKAGKEGKESKAGKEGKEGKAGKEGKESKAGKEGKEGKAGKEGKESKAGKEGKDGQAVAGQPKDTPVTETEYAEATQNGFKITKGDEVRTVTFENGGRIMHFTVNDKPMTQTEANQFMKDLQEAPNLDQEKVGLAVVQKNINEMSGSQTYAKESTQQQGTQDNTLSLNNLVAMQKGGNSMS